MNYLKDTPDGIDKEINIIQSRLYDKLDFGVDFNGYGRAYLVGSKPMQFIDDNNYKELLTDDSLAGHFFFLENPKTKKDSLLETEIYIIFILNLKKIKPNVIHRADEEVRVQIYKVLERIRLFDIEEITKGIDVLSDFEHTLKDMQPYHFIKFTGKLRYCFG